MKKRRGCTWVAKAKHQESECGLKRRDVEDQAMKTLENRGGGEEVFEGESFGYL